jgi:hypothetical protein
MEFLNKPRTWLVAGAVVLGLLFLQQIWHWGVERTEVPSDHFLVRIHLWGKDLAEDEIVAPDEDHKGVMAEELKEGRYFLNPLFWSYEIHKATNVPPGKFLVLTRKSGKPISPERLAAGEFLAEPGERGIVKEIKGPGKHYVNPHLYDSEPCDAVQIQAGEVGVETLLWGKDPRALNLPAGQNVYVVPEGFRGVQEKPLPPETYYPNPYVRKIVPVDTRTHEVEFTDIKFPSPDGYNLNPHIKVVYRVMPENAPLLFVTLSNNGTLHQGDTTEKEKQDNEILQKVVLPLIRGYARIEGSKYDARDFITQKNADGAPRSINPLEKLQVALTEKVTPPCKDLGIVIESISMGRMDLHKDKDLVKLADQISQRERTRVEREKNMELIGQYKQEQELRAAEALQAQNEKVVEAKTLLEVQKTKAEQLKEVEEAKLKIELKAAEIRLKAAHDRAEAMLNEGKNQAQVINADNESEVAGLRTAIQGFPSADAYAQFRVISKMAPALSEIFASDNSDFAKLFARYVTPGKMSVAAPTEKPPVVVKKSDSK